MKEITESGCDAVTTVRVEYRDDTTESWTFVEPDTVTKTYLTIDNVNYERYEMRLVVINNENINSTSASKYGAFNTSEFCHHEYTSRHPCLCNST